MFQNRFLSFFAVSSAANKSEGIRLSTVNRAAREGPYGYDNRGHQTDVVRNSNYDHERHNNGNRRSVPSTIPNLDNSLSWYFKVTWMFQSIWFVGALAVTILFWVVDFDPGRSVITVFNLHVHGVNLLFALIDQFLIASPYRVLHFVYASGLSLIYFIFTCIYFAAGGLNEFPEDPVNGNTYLYLGVLDWGRIPTTSIVTMVLVVFVAAPILHLLYYGLYRLRLSFGRCCKCCGNVDEI